MPYRTYSDIRYNRYNELKFLYPTDQSDLNQPLHEPQKKLFDAAEAEITASPRDQMKAWFNYATDLISALNQEAVRTQLLLRGGKALRDHPETSKAIERVTGTPDRQAMLTRLLPKDITVHQYANYLRRLHRFAGNLDTALRATQREDEYIELVPHIEGEAPPEPRRTVSEAVPADEGSSEPETPMIPLDVGASAAPGFTIMDNYLDRSEIANVRYDQTIGLRNLSADCFANSVIQCLAYLPQVTLLDRPDISNSDSFTASLLSMIHNLWNGPSDPKPISIDKLMGVFRHRLISLGVNSSKFEAFEQHDASEFFSCLIDVAEAEKNDATSSEFVDVFSGKRRTVTACRECNVESTQDNLETFSMYHVDPVAENSLAEMLRREICASSDTYRCENQECASTRGRESRHIFTNLPSVLVTSIRRFSRSDDGFWVKNDVDVSVDFHIDLSDYSIDQNRSGHYELVGAVVLHCSNFAPQNP